MKASKPSTNAIAAATVFGLPELVEQVLLCLDMKALFRLQQVNTTFQSVIAKSQALQRKMCLLIDESIGIKESIKNIANPLLLDQAMEFRKFRFCFQDPLHHPKSLAAELVVQGTDWAMDTFERMAEGSWRKTRIVRRPYGLSRADLAIEFIVEDEVVVKHFSLGEEATLGELEDATMSVMDRKCGTRVYDPWYLQNLQDSRWCPLK